MIKDALRELLNKEPTGNPIAAVLVPIIECGESRILMIKRGKDLTRSAGHVAFPGGMIEKGEDAVKTALREFEEELGVKREKIEVIGFLKTREVLEYRIKICPVVGITKDENFSPDSREVSKILVDSLEKVLASRRVTDWGASFECMGELVWGASSRVLDDLYLRIVRRYGSIGNFFAKMRESYAERR
uniref:CoA pyrophosphatase n=1 Tax=Archaeoglobus fulgidus TaxID=2234 RepID=A0A7J2THP3_ARCFL